MATYYTADLHRSFDDLEPFCQQLHTTKDDVLLVLGDAGINYYGLSRDDGWKSFLERLPITILCIHGNHENRPENITTYREIPWRGGVVFREELFPSLLFAKDGEIYDIDGLQTMVVGGAYSVDKPWRYPSAMINGYGWWPDEQPSVETRRRVEETLNARDWQIDTMLTHTAPLKYEPVEMFLSSIDQTKVDKDTEEWLDSIENRLTYRRWFCGHYHTDKQIDRMTFVMFDVREWLSGDKVFERSRRY